MRNLGKTEALKEAYGEDNFNRIQFVEASLTDDLAMAEAIKGATHVIHVASPIPATGARYAKKQIVNETVSGIRTILNACKEHRVQKLLVTSSLATIITLKKKGKEAVYDETDFAYSEKMVTDDYSMSKMLQEQEIFKFRRQCEEEGEELATEICTLHPGFVIGPVITKWSTSSVDGMRKMVMGYVPVCP